MLAGEATGTPKAQSGAVEAIRLLRVARRSAVKARTQAANQLHAVIDTSPAELRECLGSVNTEQIVTVAARFHRRHPATPIDAARLTLRTLARRWQQLDAEIAMLDAHLDELTAEAAPTLRALNGVGPQNAAALLAAAGDNRSECVRPPRSPPSAEHPRSTPPPGANNAIASTAAATARPTAPSTTSS